MYVVEMTGSADRRDESLVAIGVWDGLHRVHQAALRHVHDLADDLGVATSVLTFEQPSEDEAGGGSPRKRLTTLDQRLELIEETKLVDRVWVVPEAPSAPATESFVREVLVDQVKPRAVVLRRNGDLGGFGHVDVPTLERLGSAHGFDVVAFERALCELTDLNESCSVAAVTECLAEGDVRGAAELLGRSHEMRGVVEQGDQRGRTLGFPTANLAVPDTLVIPAEGVYAGTFIAEDGVERMTAISLGRRPTFYPSGLELLEAHVLDFDGDLYGQSVRVRFIDFLRRQVKFNGIDQLVAQLQRDVARARDILRAEAEGR